MRQLPETVDVIEWALFSVPVCMPEREAVHAAVRDCATVGSTGRPGRVRPRGRTETDEKLKKPVEGVRKKPPPTRKAPARGRYVDEYARAPR